MKRFMQNQFLGRGIGTALAVALIIGAAAGQNIVVTGGGNFSNSGTIKVKGNINTNGASGAVTIGGTVELNGTTQSLGVSGSNALILSTLSVLGTDTKTMAVNVSVSDALTVNNGSGKLLDVANKVLTIGGTSALAGGASLDVTDSGCEVVFNNTGGSQTVLGLTYAGKLTLQNSGTKNLSADASVAGTFAHSGGNVTLNHNLSVAGDASFATVADVTGNSTLAFSGTGVKSIAAVSGVAGGSAISNTGASGLLTVTALNGNSGTINTGAGGVTFTNAATNGGNITGGAGAVTFSSTLAHSAGIITAGGGGVVFNGIPTISSGSITAGTGANLDFNANIANSGTISLTGSGSATLNGDFSSVGTLSFAGGSSVTFDGNTQNIPSTTYGNLTSSGTGAKTALGNITVSGTGTGLTLTNSLSMSTFTLTMDQAGTAINGTSEITGLVRRNHAFVGGTAYAFHRSNVTMSLASNGSADMTLGMYPNTDPTAGIGAKYAKRKYTLSSATDVSSNNLTAQLYYLDSELQGTPNETKFGVYRHNGSAWAKITTNSGTYTRDVAGAPNTIQLSNINEGLTGIAELGLRTLEYITVASGGWNTVATWGTTLADIPTATDDAIVRHNVTGLEGSSRSIATLTIQDDLTYDGQLTVDANTFTADVISSTGTLNVTSGAVLAVNGGLSNNTDANGASAVTISGTANISGLVVNAGTLTANGASAIVNATAGLTNSGTLAVNHANGQVTISGGDFANSGLINNTGTITVE